MQKHNNIENYIHLYKKYWSFRNASIKKKYISKLFSEIDVKRQIITCHAYLSFENLLLFWKNDSYDSFQKARNFFYKKNNNLFSCQKVLEIGAGYLIDNDLIHASGQYCGIDPIYDENHLKLYNKKQNSMLKNKITLKSKKYQDLNSVKKQDIVLNSSVCIPQKDIGLIKNILSKQGKYVFIGPPDIELLKPKMLTSLENKLNETWIEIIQWGHRSIYTAFISSS